MPGMRAASTCADSGGIALGDAKRGGERYQLDRSEARLDLPDVDLGVELSRFRCFPCSFLFGVAALRASPTRLGFGGVGGDSPKPRCLAASAAAAG